MGMDLGCSLALDRGVAQRLRYLVHLVYGRSRDLFDFATSQSRC